MKTRFCPASTLGVSHHDSIFKSPRTPCAVRTQPHSIYSFFIITILSHKSKKVNRSGKFAADRRKNAAIRRKNAVDRYKIAEQLPQKSTAVLLICKL
jgi:hypothetical protein